jgi:hypothetical protein
MTGSVVVSTGSARRRALRPIDSSARRPLVGATLAIAGLLIVAAGSGLFLDPYQDETPFGRNGFRGADLVTVVVVLPLLLAAGRTAMRGSRRGRLLWLGALGYVAYQYGYVFAYSWSRLFLVYLALLSIAAFTMAAALVRLDVDEVAARFDPATPTRATARFLTFIGVGLGVMELAQIVPSVFTGDTPQIVVDTAHPTSPVFVLDLGLVVPLLFLSARWVRQRHPWGYVASTIMLIKGATVGLSLLAANLFALFGDDKSDGPLVLLWVAIAGGSAVVLWRFLRNVHEPESPARAAHGTRS